MNLRFITNMMLIEILPLASGCTSSSEDIRSVSIFLSDGEEYKEIIGNEIIVLEIRPKSSSIAQNASSSRLIIDGKVINAIIGGSKYNIRASLIPCKSVNPGKNIKIEYNYLSQSGAVVESGQVTLAEVVATCN